MAGAALARWQGVRAASSSGLPCLPRLSRLAQLEDFGFDLDDCAYVPVASAMDLFNQDELNEIDVLASSTEVIDRVADVMHSKKGEMFSPMFLENKLKFSPYIKEAVIFGDKRDFVSCLINIDPIVVGKWAEDRGISFTTYMDLSNKPEVAELLKEAVADINARAEKKHFRIKRFAVLYKLLDMDDGELTKTGKIRRMFVNERYADLVEALRPRALAHARRALEMRERFGVWGGKTEKERKRLLRGIFD